MSLTSLSASNPYSTILASSQMNASLAEQEANSKPGMVDAAEQEERSRSTSETDSESDDDARVKEDRCHNNSDAAEQEERSHSTSETDSESDDDARVKEDRCHNNSDAVGWEERSRSTSKTDPESDDDARVKEDQWDNDLKDQDPFIQKVFQAEKEKDHQQRIRQQQIAKKAEQIAQTTSKEDSEPLDAGTQSQPPVPKISPEKAPLTLKVHNPNEPLRVQVAKKLYFGNAPTTYDHLQKRDRTKAFEAEQEARQNAVSDPERAKIAIQKKEEYLARRQKYQQQQRLVVEHSLAEVKETLENIQIMQEEAEDRRQEQASIPLAGTYSSPFGLFSIFKKV